MATGSKVGTPLLNSLLQTFEKIESEKSSVAQPLVQNTMDIVGHYFPLFYASERGPLGIWEKESGLGLIKRRLETEGAHRFHVLELTNAHASTGTYIMAPKHEWMALHVTLPHLVVVMRSFRRNFSFEVQVLDNKGFLRRFSVATYYNPYNLKKLNFLCQIPLRLELGWNEIHLDLNDLLMRTYKTKLFETVKVMVHANCKIRQIYFCSDEVLNGEVTVPGMNAFENVKLVNPSFGQLNHPNYYEPGPHGMMSPSRNVPPPKPLPTRIERDLRLIHIQRFDQVSKNPKGSTHSFKNFLDKSKALAYLNWIEAPEEPTVKARAHNHKKVKTAPSKTPPSTANANESENEAEAPNPEPSSTSTSSNNNNKTSASQPGVRSKPKSKPRPKPVSPIPEITITLPEIFEEIPIPAFTLAPVQSKTPGPSFTESLLLKSKSESKSKSLNLKGKPKPSSPEPE